MLSALTALGLEVTSTRLVDEPGAYDPRERSADPLPSRSRRAMLAPVRRMNVGLDIRSIHTDAAAPGGTERAVITMDFWASSGCSSGPSSSSRTS